MSDHLWVVLEPDLNCEENSGSPTTHQGGPEASVSLSAQEQG